MLKEKDKPTKSSTTLGFVGVQTQKLAGRAMSALAVLLPLALLLHHAYWWRRRRRKTTCCYRRPQDKLTHKIKVLAAADRAADDG